MRRVLLLAATVRATSAALALPSVLTTRGHNATAYVVAAAPGGCFHSPICGVNFSLAWALADVMSGTLGSFFFLCLLRGRFVAPVSTL